VLNEKHMIIYSVIGTLIVRFVFSKEANYMLGFYKHIAIDIGTANMLVYEKGKGIVFKEPSVIVIDRNSNQVFAVGEKARCALGKTPKNLMSVKPLRHGVISDLKNSVRMLEYVINGVCGLNVFKLNRPSIMICVPSCLTKLDKKSIIDAILISGAHKVSLIDIPIAASIGAGIDVFEAKGSMIIDIGSSITDIAVISLGGIVVSDSVKIGGDSFDESIIRYVRRTYNIEIGERTAEEIKIKIGSVLPVEQETVMDVCGKNLFSGLPEKIQIRSSNVIKPLQQTAQRIVDAIIAVFERTPEELVSDIIDSGLVLTGGGSLMHGLDMLISRKIMINTIVAKNPMECTVRGAGTFLDIKRKSGLESRV
jgi:rod shape-determining protein MreB and related proteins